jgi:hypothetical protein
MGRFYLDVDHFPLEDQVKGLADDELLDFWEETQFVERALADNADDAPEPNHMEYERVILRELMLRTCLRTLEAGR